MKRVFLVLFLSIMTLAAGCTKDPVNPDEPGQPQEPEKPEVVKPSISIKAIKTDHSSITFEAKIENAEKAAYVLLQGNEKEPEAAAIIQNGHPIPVSDPSATIRIENLKGDTVYRIVSAANSHQEFTLSNVLEIRTDKDPEVEIQVEILETTFESVAFKVVQQNADRMSYMILPAQDANPTLEEVLGRGEKIDPASADRIEAGNLKDRAEYKLVVAATGFDQKVITPPVTFRTKEDESKIIRQNYSLGKALVSPQNYYVQFYHEGNENEILSLDFYADGGKYLPAGVYEVKDIDSPSGIGIQFSKYGTSSIGTKLSSGTAEVTMDKPAGIYSFHVDIFLEDGQHVIAEFEGEIENMPIRETIDFDAAYPSASRFGNGWNIRFSNPDKTEKIELSIAAENEKYLEEARYGLSDRNTGSYYNAAGERFPFKEGEFNAVINWEKLTYSISFSGALEDRTLITFKYEGEIPGMTIQQPTTENELVFTAAKVIAFDDGNYFVTLSNSEESYNSLTLDFYCEPFTCLREGTYIYGGSEPGYFSTSSKLVGTDRDFLYLDEGTAEVSYSGENFIIDFTGTVEDGRVFHTRYEGLISGMTVPGN